MGALLDTLRGSTGAGGEGDGDFQKQMTRSLKAMVQSYALQLEAARREATSQLQAQMEILNATLHADTDSLRKELDDAISHLLASEAHTKQCLDMHRTEFEELQSKYLKETQKCVDVNMGPFLNSVKKFQFDLDTYANNAQKLVREGMECATPACALDVGKRLAQLHMHQSRSLADDYVDLDLKGMMAIDAVRRCTERALGNDSSVLSAFLSTIVKCIEEQKRVSGSSDGPSQSSSPRCSRKSQRASV